MNEWTVRQAILTIKEPFRPLSRHCPGSNVIRPPMLWAARRRMGILRPGVDSHARNDHPHRHQRTFETISIPKGTLYNLVYLRRIPFVKRGRSLRFDPQEVVRSLPHYDTMDLAGQRWKGH